MPAPLRSASQQEKCINTGDLDLGPRGDVKLLAALLVLAAFIAYLPALSAGFIWDDGLLLTSNPNMIDAGGLAKIWLGKDSCDYTPLTLTSFWLEKRLWDDMPIGYHVVNILLHALAAVLLWRTLERLRLPGAWLAALLFAIHPVNVASVAWIAERKNTLSAALFFASVLSFLVSYKDGSSLHHPSTKSHNTKFYVLSIALFLLAGLSKGAVATMPIVLCGCILWMNRKITRDDLLRLIAFILIAIAVSLLTIRYQSHAVDYELLPANLAFRIVRAGAAPWLYLEGIVFPIGLSPMVAQWLPNVRSPIVYLPAVSIAGIVGLFFAKRKSWGRPLLFAYGYYLVMLLPVLGLIRMTLQQETPCTDWWQYLAAPGIFAGIAGGFATTLAATRRHTRLSLHALLYVVVALLLVQTWRRCLIYRSMETYCSAVLTENPHAWSLQTNLGVMLKQRGEVQKAIACHRQALRDNPRFVEAHNNLGNALSAVGKWQEAEAQFLVALELSPSNSDVLENLADTYLRQGKIGDALAAEARAVKADRHNSQRYVQFALMLAGNNQFEQAVVCLKNAVLLAPGDIAIRVTLAWTLIAAGCDEEASVACGQALDMAKQTGNREVIQKVALLSNQCRPAAQ
jgi:protein O-mannosyl-transferase